MTRANAMTTAAGAWLVAVPIAAFVLLRAVGAPAGVAEDLVTLLVMVPLGGPHVAATFARTLFARPFWRAEPKLAAASMLVVAIVVATTVASAFGDARIGGRPPMLFLLTFFFFWAGLHVVQQHCFVVQALARGLPAAARRHGWIDHVLMLLALYPASLFRMSMANGADATGSTADPEALATRVVYALGGSGEFADAYVFRIGRAAPILPDSLRHPAFWIAVTVAFVAAAVAFVGKSLAALRAGLPFGARGRLVVAMAGFGALVPLFPSLDAAFQGINAWHAYQYLGVAALLHRGAVARGEVQAGWLADLARPERARRGYACAVGATLLLVLAMLALAFVLERASDGRFVMFGHDAPPRDPATGRALYRPGSLLLAYYLLGFGFLLVHYLQDTVHFLRRPPVLTAG